MTLASLVPAPTLKAFDPTDGDGDTLDNVLERTAPPRFTRQQLHNLDGSVIYFNDHQIGEHASGPRLDVGSKTAVEMRFRRERILNVVRAAVRVERETIKSSRGQCTTHLCSWDDISPHLLDPVRLRQFVKERAEAEAR